MWHFELKFAREFRQIKLTSMRSPTQVTIAIGSNNFFTGTRHDVGHAELSKKAALSCHAIHIGLRVQAGTAA